MTRLKVAIIGGGWAGLAAAEVLAKDADVTLYEASKHLGGRARAVNADDDKMGEVDNGHHLLFGSYRQCLALLQRAGVDVNDAFVRLPLTWYLVGGIFLQTVDMPAPWHWLVGVMRAEGISFPDKLSLIAQMRRLEQWYRDYDQHRQDVPFGTWLNENNVPEKWQQEFWRPIVLGSLNTDLADASTVRFANLLADGIWSSRRDSDFLLGRQNLTEIWVKPVSQYLLRLGLDIQMSRRVGMLRTHEGGGVWVDDCLYDKVILAIESYHASSLLPPNTPKNVRDAFADLNYYPITTVYLRYKHKVKLPQPLVGMIGGHSKWLIERAGLGGDENELIAVVSLARLHPEYQAPQWIEAVHQDVLRVCPDIGKPIAAKVITEKRAVVATRHDRSVIPQSWLRSHGIYLAGDYLHTRYPTTLEAAVQSGQVAANQCLADSTVRVSPKMKWLR